MNTFLRITTLVVFLTLGLYAVPLYAAPVRPIPIKPEHMRPAVLRIWQADFQATREFSVGDQKTLGGGELAAGDLDGDGIQEIVVGSGLGSDPKIWIYHSDGTLISSFLAYAAGFKGGARIAVGDLDGDGKAEIVTAPGPGAESRIEIFDLAGHKKLSQKMLAYASSFRGGVHVAVGDLDGDGKAEIVTAPGPGGGPHIRVWNQGMENLGLDFFAFDQAMREGVSLAIAKNANSSRIVTAIESWSAPQVRLFSRQSGFQVTNSFLAFDEGTHSGVRISTADLDNDGTDEIIAVQNGGSSPLTRVFSQQGSLRREISMQDAAYQGSLAIAELHQPQQAVQLISMPIMPVVVGPTSTARLIDVDLSEQRLYAYEHGRIAKSYLISSGIGRFPTPQGKTQVLRKSPVMDYRWNYGPGNPDNYFLPNVKFNLNIFPHIYLHSAYWHNNFGNRMSHGCINESLSDAEWLFQWAATGTAVDIHQ